MRLIQTKDQYKDTVAFYVTPTGDLVETRFQTAFGEWKRTVLATGCRPNADVAVLQGKKGTVPAFPEEGIQVATVTADGNLLHAFWPFGPNREWFVEVR